MVEPKKQRVLLLVLGLVLVLVSVLLVLVCTGIGTSIGIGTSLVALVQGPVTELLERTCQEAAACMHHPAATVKPEYNCTDSGCTDTGLVYS